VAVNFTAEPQTVNLAASGAGLQAAHLKTLLKTPGGPVPRSLAASSWVRMGFISGKCSRGLLLPSSLWLLASSPASGVGL